MIPTKEIDKRKSKILKKNQVQTLNERSWRCVTSVAENRCRGGELILLIQRAAKIIHSKSFQIM
jgi:hypothetical protein